MTGRHRVLLIVVMVLLSASIGSLVQDVASGRGTPAVRSDGFTVALALALLVFLVLDIRTPSPSMPDLERRRWLGLLGLLIGVAIGVGAAAWLPTLAPTHAHIAVRAGIAAGVLVGSALLLLALFARRPSR